MKAIKVVQDEQEKGIKSNEELKNRCRMFFLSESSSFTMRCSFFLLLFKHTRKSAWHTVNVCKGD